MEFNKNLSYYRRKIKDKKVEDTLYVIVCQDEESIYISPVDGGMIMYEDKKHFIERYSAGLMEELNVKYSEE